MIRKIRSSALISHDLAVFRLVMVLAVIISCGASAWAAMVRADALVIVNSASPGFSDFGQRIQPYLKNFGVPYAVLDLAWQPLDSSIENYPLLIIGHKQIGAACTNLDDPAQTELTAAVRKGTGLVNFDSDLQLAGTNRYQFIQDIFGFGYNGMLSVSNVIIMAPPLGDRMHFITALHDVNDFYYYHTPTNSLIPRLVLSNATALAESRENPIIVVANFGLGRAVQWATYDWMAPESVGPLGGLDDLVWRGFVWAAQKPFVLRGLPPFLTLRMDDVAGENDPTVPPFWWVNIANEFGFKPWMGLFIDYIDARKGSAVRDLVNAGLATAAIHAFRDNHEVYFSGGGGVSYPDDVLSNNIAQCQQFLANNSIHHSSVLIAHSGDLGTNTAWALQALGVEFPFVKSYPGTLQSAPWLMIGPYRLYDRQQPGNISWPTWYADFLKVPGHPEFSRFFNCGTEIRNYCLNEWCPSPATNDLAETIRRGTEQLKRSFDSFALATLFTHEFRLISNAYAPPVSEIISTDLWRAQLQGIVSQLASYQPIYVTLDEACRYARATRTSQLESSTFDPDSGIVTATFSGTAEVATVAYTFIETNGVITNFIWNVPPFTDGMTNSCPVSPAQQAASIQLTPLQASVPPFQSIQFSAVVLDGSFRPLWPQQAVQWSTSGEGTIDGTGLFIAGIHLGGPFVVTASLGGIVATATVTVACSGPVFPPQPNRVVPPLQPLIITNSAASPPSASSFVTNSWLFTYSNRDALLGDGWSYIGTAANGLARNTEIMNLANGAIASYDQTNHPGILRIPCDYSDLWNPGGYSRNMLLRPLPTNWVSVVAAMDFFPTAIGEATHLTLYQNDDNYVQAGRSFNGVLQRVTMTIETNGAATTIFSTPWTNSSSDPVLLRLSRSSSADAVVQDSFWTGGGWAPVGQIKCNLNQPQIALWAGGTPWPGYTNGGRCMDLRWLEITTQTNLPTVLTYSLLEAPQGASIDQNGVINWTPGLDQAPSTNWITSVVIDNGSPAQSATNRFQVMVLPASQCYPTLAATVGGAGLELSWPANWSNYVMEGSTSIDGSSPWLPITNVQTAPDLHFYITAPLTNTQQFFRLRR
jgi:hypothetical protein